MASPVKIWRNQKYFKTLVGKKGTIVTYTIVRVPPSGYSQQAPYAVAVVALDDGRIITCQCAEYVVSAIHMNAPVRLAVRRLKEADDDGIIQYGIKAILL